LLEGLTLLSRKIGIAVEKRKRSPRGRKKESASVVEGENTSRRREKKSLSSIKFYQRSPNDPINLTERTLKKGRRALKARGKST